MKVEWKVIEGTDGRYEVCNAGFMVDMNEKKVVEGYRIAGDPSRRVLYYVKENGKKHRRSPKLSNLIYRLFSGDSRLSIAVHHIDGSVENNSIYNLTTNPNFVADKNHRDFDAYERTNILAEKLLGFSLVNIEWSPFSLLGKDYEICRSGYIRNVCTGVLYASFYHYKNSGYHIFLGDGHSIPVRELLAKAFIPNPHSLPYLIRVSSDMDSTGIEDFCWSHSSQNSQIIIWDKTIESPVRLCGEVWKDVPDCRVRCEVSNFGRIRKTLDDGTMYNGNVVFRSKSRSPRLVAIPYNVCSVLVELRSVVYECFGNEPLKQGYIVCNKDGNPYNCNISNLCQSKKNNEYLRPYEFYNADANTGKLIKGFVSRGALGNVARYQDVQKCLSGEVLTKKGFLWADYQGLFHQNVYAYLEGKNVGIDKGDPVNKKNIVKEELNGGIMGGEFDALDEKAKLYESYGKDYKDLLESFKDVSSKLALAESKIKNSDKDIKMIEKFSNDSNALWAAQMKDRDETIAKLEKTISDLNNDLETLTSPCKCFDGSPIAEENRRLRELCDIYETRLTLERMVAHVSSLVKMEDIVKELLPDVPFLRFVMLMKKSKFLSETDGGLVVETDGIPYFEENDGVMYVTPLGVNYIKIKFVSNYYNALRTEGYDLGREVSKEVARGDSI